MSGERFSRAEKLYHQALSRPPEEREALLERECAGDEDLLRNVRSLLALRSDAGDLLQQPVAEAATARVAVVRGTRLGPYEVGDFVGAGGMGEVYRARDNRLGRDVAVKVLPPEVARDPQRLRLFEREARAVAALNHPNVLTVHDVGRHDGTPYVVTELLEGETLRHLVSHRTPSVRQLLGYALEAARGLEAAHARGIVHRDLKPENLFLTSEGRVKVLDFGLARVLPEPGAGTEPVSATHPGQVMGTAAYMSPEQAHGEALDARSDVFSFGVVLHELLGREHPFRKTTLSATLQAIAGEAPPPLDGRGLGVPPAVAGIVRRCLEKAREDRYASGHDLVVALEAVVAHPTGAAALRDVEERSPYPGLRSFTAKDAAVFFGREKEVGALWTRLERAPLLALIGPSGAGKTSFVRAGVVPKRPEGWAVVVATPGSSPMRSLARALAPELISDPEALVQLPDFEDPEVAVSLVDRWHRGHAGALVVLDQFEELFTLNPPEVQEAFADLLGRLASEAGVCVLLSLRDDFLIRCHAHPALAPVFQDLTPLLPLTGDDLRRALEEPAHRHGYRFEDAALAAEMVEAAEGARTPLPLLAFAVSRLWEKRDRDGKVLTRAAYDEIGGVSGALAQHAEKTLERIGPEREPIVREVFRNLVTAQGTRATRTRDELLSVFGGGGSGNEGSPGKLVEAEAVLQALVDARLLTEYERSTEADAGDVHEAQIEITHESLLGTWPRLVRWQTQDADGAQLRDQLRQAAQLWQEKGRPEDLLWAGTSEREYEVWRARYPGRLSSVEEDFARAMVDRAQRRKRLRRLAVASVVVVLSVVAGAIAVSRQQAVEQARRAEAEARRADAARLLGLGQLVLEGSPNFSLAYALASLERADTAAARRFVVESLAHGAAGATLPVDSQSLAFSPDGRWLATSGTVAGLRLWAREGGPPVARVESEGQGTQAVHFDPRAPLLAVHTGSGRRVLSIPDLSPVPVSDPPSVPSFSFLRDSHLLTFSRDERGFTVRREAVGGGDVRLLGRWNGDGGNVSPDGTRLLYFRGREILLLPLDDLGGRPRRLGRHPAAVARVGFASGGDRVASSDVSGEIRVWAIEGTTATLERAIASGLESPAIALGPGGSTLAARPGGSGEWAPHLWDLGTGLQSEPRILRAGGGLSFISVALDPSGRWAAGGRSYTELWALDSRYGHVIGRQPPPELFIAFTADGAGLASISTEGVLRVSPLSPEGTAIETPLARGTIGAFPGIAVDPEGRFLLVVCNRTRALLVPTDGGRPRDLERFSSAWLTTTPAISRDGRLAAAGSRARPEGNLIELWDLASGAVETLDPRPREGERECGSPPYSDSAVSGLDFTADGRLLTLGQSGLRLWNLDDGTNVLLRPCTPAPSALPRLAASATERYLILEATGTDRRSTLSLFDLPSGAFRELTAHGSAVTAVGLSRDGQVAVTGDRNGLVRVGPVDDAEPHLLYGHEAEVTSVAVSPDGRWVASASDDGTIRLWPMPTGRPLQTLPYEELLTRVGSFTNLRVVRDEGSESGYRIEIGPFQGWATFPEW